MRTTGGLSVRALVCTNIPPKSDMAIPTTRREIGSYRAEINRKNRIIMSDKCALSHGAVDVPENRGFVI
jgi:hypothetical protein